MYSYKQLHWFFLQLKQARFNNDHTKQLQKPNQCLKL